jgi:hypothetical protein
MPNKAKRRWEIRPKRKPAAPEPRTGDAPAQRGDAVSVRMRGTALEARRRLRPVGGAASSALRRVAHPITSALLVVVRIPAGLIATLLDFAQEAWAAVRSRLGPVAAGVAVRVSAVVTPLRTVAVVAAAAAVALGASQFADYSGVAVGAPGYEGEVGSVAPAPMTDLQTTGSAHLYLPLPLAAIALGLIWATARGRWRLGRVVSLVGLAGIALALLVDMPQGLDRGNADLIYSGTDARLLEGFWAQIAASAVLIGCGPMLAFYARRAAGEPRRSRSRLGADRGTRAPAAMSGGGSLWTEPRA